MTGESNHLVGSRSEWLKARLELLELEKEHTRRGDEIAKKRQALPWVLIEKKFKFDTEDGEAGLVDLFGSRSQLLVYHFMFGPDYKAGCPSCSAIADGFNAIIAHLNHHDVSLWAISLASLSNLIDYKRRMKWQFPWASSANSDFNFDFASSFTVEEQCSGKIDYNYRIEAPVTESFQWRPGEDGGGLSAEEKFAKMSGTDVRGYHRQRPGMSAFIKKGDQVYHTYSTYARGLDALWSMYPWLDRAPLGRNENGPWWKRHDEY